MLQYKNTHNLLRDQDEELPRLAMAEETTDNDNHLSIHRIYTALPWGKR